MLSVGPLCTSLVVPRGAPSRRVHDCVDDSRGSGGAVVVGGCEVERMAGSSEARQDGLSLRGVGRDAKRGKG